MLYGFFGALNQSINNYKIADIAENKGRRACARAYRRR